LAPGASNEARWQYESRRVRAAACGVAGAGDEVIMSIAWHVSRAMLSRYSHVRMEAKQRALDEKRRKGAERREQLAIEQILADAQAAEVIRRYSR
jgi:hypothetical protein